MIHTQSHSHSHSHPLPYNNNSSDHHNVEMLTISRNFDNFKRLIHRMHVCVTSNLKKINKKNFLFHIRYTYAHTHTHTCYEAELW